MVDMEPKAPAFANPTQQTSTMQHDTVAQESTHKHNGSDGTRMSTSAESSPTTTLSTTDSSPLSDPSPSSSPDSPLTLIPLNNYPATSFGAPFNTKPMQDAGEMSGFERPMTSPSPRRPRNMKGTVHPATRSSDYDSHLVGFRTCFAFPLSSQKFLP